MRLTTCPRCGKPVQPTDTTCMECGLDLIEASKKLVEDTTNASAARRPAAAIRNPNAAGMATDVGEDTRLHVFDEQLAKEFQAGRTASVVSGVIALGLGLALLMIGLSATQRAGGLGPAVQTLSPSHLRTATFGIFAEPGFQGAVCLLLASCAFLICIGQLHWAWAAHQAIQDVKLGGRPSVVGISALTAFGLVVASLLCPPLGILLGILFKLSKDGDTRDLATRMLVAAGLAILYFVLVYLWSLTGGLSANTAAPAAAGRAAGAVAGG